MRVEAGSEAEGTRRGAFTTSRLSTPSVSTAPSALKTVVALASALAAIFAWALLAPSAIRSGPAAVIEAARSIAVVRTSADDAPVVFAVSPGQKVSAGDEVFSVQIEGLKKSAGDLGARRIALEARLARLKAEHSQLARFRVPERWSELGPSEKAVAAEVMAREREAYSSFAGNNKARSAGALGELLKIDGEVNTLRNELQVRGGQLDKLDAEIAQLQDLRRRGLQQIPRLDALLLERNAVLAQREQINAALGNAEARRDQLADQQGPSQTENLNAAIRQLDSELLEIADQHDSALAALADARKTAPFDGQVAAILTPAKGPSSQHGEALAIIVGPDAQLTLALSIKAGTAALNKAGKRYQVRLRMPDGDLSPKLADVVSGDARTKQTQADKIRLVFSRSELVKLSEWRAEAIADLREGAKLAPIDQSFDQVLYQQLLAPFAPEFGTHSTVVILQLPSRGSDRS